MSGFVNSDGSELVGGQKSGGVGQSLQLDASGNLLVNVAVGGGGGGGSVVNIADPNTPTNKLAVDASGRVGINNFPSVQGINLAQIAGAAPVMSTADGVAGSSVQLESVGIWNGTGVDRVLGLHGAMSIQDWIRYLTLKGQAFSITTGVATSGATAGINALSLFNPAASGKTVMVYILKSFSATAGQPQTSLTTTDPALGTSLTPLNNMPGSSTSSVTSCTTSASVVTLAGNVQDVGSIVANALYEAFENGRCTILSPGNGIEHGVYAAATTKYGITIYWVEF